MLNYLSLLSLKRLNAGHPANRKGIAATIISPPELTACRYKGIPSGRSVALLGGHLHRFCVLPGMAHRSVNLL